MNVFVGPTSVCSRCIMCLSRIKQNRLKSEYSFVYFKSNIIFTEKYTEIHFPEVWLVFDSPIDFEMSLLHDDLKRNFFHSTVESVLCYGSTNRVFPNHKEAMLDAKGRISGLSILQTEHPTKNCFFFFSIC